MSRSISVSAEWESSAAVSNVITDAKATEAKILNHKRMGHLGRMDNCTTCKLSKQKHQATTAVLQNPAKWFLHMVAIDVCGPVEMSKTMKKYMVIIIDIFTRFAFVHCIATRDKVLEAVQFFLFYFGRPQIWRTDNAPEQISEKMSKLISPGVIQRVPPYEHDYNGFVERAIATITKIARCMLHEAALGHEYWTYAVAAACRVYNMATHSALDMSPFEKAYARKPALEKQRVFGCNASLLPPRELRRSVQKFLPQTIQGRYMGIDAISNQFIIEDSEGKIVQGRQVNFYERVNNRTGDCMEFHTLQAFDERSNVLMAGDPTQSDIIQIDAEGALDPEVRMSQSTQHRCMNIIEQTQAIQQVNSSYQVTAAEHELVCYDDDAQPHVLVEDASMDHDSVLTPDDYMLLCMLEATINKSDKKWQEAIDREWKKHDTQKTMREATNKIGKILGRSTGTSHRCHRLSFARRKNR